MENENKNTSVTYANSGVQAPGLSVAPEPQFNPQALSLDPVAQQPAVTGASKKTPFLLRLVRRADVVLAVLLVLGSFGLLLNVSMGKDTPKTDSAASRFDTVEIPLGNFATEEGVSFGEQSVTINGALQLNNAFVVGPSIQPANAKAGQIYYDQTSNVLAYFNGTEFVPVVKAESDTGVQNIGGVSGSITLGDGLTVVGGQLANSGVLSVQGLTGNVTFTGGNGIAVSGTTITNTGIVSVISSSPSLTVANDGSGNVTLGLTGAGTGTVSSPGGTPGSIAKFTGAQTIADSLLSESGSVVTASGDLNVTGSLSLGIALSVSEGGTGASSLAANGVLVGQGTSSITAVTGSPGQCLIVSGGGAPVFGSCTGGGVASLNSLTGALTIANSSGVGSTITIDDATTGAKGIASFNGSNFSVTGGAVNTIQDINSGATPTFAGVNTNSITPSAALTVGVAGQSLTLQGNGSTSLRATSSGNTTILSFTAPTANTTLNLPALGAGTYDICTSNGNCAGAGVTLQAAYNNSTNPEITVDSTRGALTVRDNSTPIVGNLLEVQNNAGGTTYFGVSTAGVSVTGTTTSSGNINTTGGGVQTNSTTRLDNTGNLQNIGTLTLSGAISGGTTYSGSGNINTTGGVLQTNSTTRVDNTGNLLNIGNITATGAITVASTGGGNNIILNSAGTIELQDSTNITGNLDVSGTLTVGTADALQVAAGGDITTAGNATLQGGTVTLGTTSQAGSLVLNDGSTQIGTLLVAALGQDTVYTLPDPGAGTATICLTSGNCAGVGGGVTGTGTNNRLAKFTSTGSTVGDSTITDDGTSVTTTADMVIQGGDLTVGTTAQTASLVLHDGNGQSTTLQAGDSSGPLTFILPTNAGSANQCLKQSGTGNQLVWDACDGGGGGSSATLQTAYGNGNIITTTDARDIDIVLADTTTDSNLDIVVATGSTGFLSLTRANGAGTADPAQMLLIDNLDADRTQPIGLKLQATFGMTTAIDASDGEIGDALNVGANNIVGTTGNINMSNFDVVGSSGDVTTAGDVAVNGGDITSTGGLAVTAGSGNIVLNTSGTIELQDSTNITGNLDVSGTLTSGTADAFQVAANGTITTAGSATIQGGTLTVGAAAQPGSLVLSDGSSTNGIFVTATLASDRTYTFPDATGEVCLNTGNCAGAGVTLQSAYNNSTNPEIVVNDTIDGLTIRDNATPITGNLLEVQDNAGSATYFSVNTSGVSVTGTTTSSGNINTSGGALQTNGTTRIDNSGNATNIGSLTLSGAISGGTTYSGSGNINTSGGSLQTAGTSRVDNSGNLVNIGNLTATSAITIASTGGGNDIILNSAGTIELQDDTNISGNVLIDGTAANALIVQSSANGTGIDVLNIQQSDGDSVLRVTDTGTIAVGNATLAGQLTVADGSSSFGNIVTTTLGSDRTYTLPDASGTVCLDTGNCAGAGTGVTTSGGTANRLPVFSAAQAIVNSWLLQNSSTLELDNTRNLSLLGGNFSVTGNVTASGTYNTNTFTSSALTFGAAATATIQSAASQALTLTSNAAATWSTSAGNLTIQAAGANTLALDTAGVGTVTVGGTNAGTITIGKSTSNAAITLQGLSVIRPTSGNDSATALLIQNGAATETLFSADTTARNASGGNLLKVGNSTGTDTALTILKLDSATADPTSDLAGLNGGLFYNSTTHKVSLVENGVVKIICNTTDLGCGTGTVTLQSAYGNGNTITTTDNRNIEFNLADTATDSNFLVNLQCDTSCSTNGRFAIQDDGADVFTVSPATGIVNFKNSTNNTQAFNIEDQSGSNLFTVDTSNSRVGINLGGSVTPAINGSGLEIQGALRMSGGSTFIDTFATPAGGGGTINGKITVPSYNPGAGNTIIALGVLDGTGSDTATGISVFDTRTNANHWPTISVWSPDESRLFGLTWAGSNTEARVTTHNSTGNTGAAALQSGDTAGSSTSSGAVSVRSGNGVGSNNSTGAVSIDSGSPSGSGTAGAISVGTTNTRSITIGNGSGATAVSVQCGTGTCGFGNNAVAHTTTIGSVTGAATTTLQGGTGGVNVGTGGIANTIQIGNTTGAVTQVINVGNNATASSVSNVTIGSLLGASTTTIQAGTGDINLTTNAATATIIAKSSTNSNEAFKVVNSSNASLLTVKTNGTLGADMGVYILGTGTAGAGSRLFFGSDILHGAFIGEAGTTNTDKLMLFGDSGIEFRVADPDATTYEPILDMSTNGLAVFRPMDSAFGGVKFLEDDGYQFFNADTNTNTIQIGNYFEDNEAVTLLLDWSNGSDPVGASAADGAMYYNVDTQTFRCHENGGWTDCISRHKIILGSNVADSSGNACTMTNITGLSFSITGGTNYRFHANLAYTAAATTTGSRFSVNGPSTPTVLSFTTRSGLTATTESVDYANTYDGGTCTASTPSTASTGNTATIEGTIRPSADGTFQLRVGTEVDTSAITVLAGSTLEWW